MKFVPDHETTKYFGYDIVAAIPVQNSLNGTHDVIITGYHSIKGDSYTWLATYTTSEGIPELSYAHHFSGVNALTAALDDMVHRASAIGLALAS